MGGEVNVYEVKRYMPEYILKAMPIIEQLLLEGLTYDKAGDKLATLLPASVTVGVGFYRRVVRQVVERRPDLRELYEKNRRQVRSATMTAVREAGHALSGEELAAMRRAWFEADQARRERYAELARQRDKLGWTGHWHDTPWGYKVRSLLELEAHKWLHDHGIDFEFEVHLGHGKHADLLIGDVFVEIDGVKGGRDASYWQAKYGNLDYVVIQVNPHDPHRRRKLLEQLAKVCEDQGYQVSG